MSRKAYIQKIKNSLKFYLNFNLIKFHNLFLYKIKFLNIYILYWIDSFHPQNSKNSQLEKSHFEKYNINFNLKSI